jgi:hypothetical protein
MLEQMLHIIPVAFEGCDLTWSLKNSQSGLMEFQDIFVNDS